MKYCLVSWTANYPDGRSFSGNATMTFEQGLPPTEAIVKIIKTNNPNLKSCEITLQDKLEFDSQRELDTYGRV